MPETELEAVRRELRAVRRELRDVRSGAVAHKHVPYDGSPEFGCSSPYCEDLTTPAPRGAPPAYAEDLRYRRED